MRWRHARRCALTAAQKASEAQYEMTTYYLVLLYRGPKSTGVVTPETQSIQDAHMANIRRMAALHKRLALMEMTKHEFLDEKFRKERTTFSDGTTVTVDWDASACEIQPELTRQ